MVEGTWKDNIKAQYCLESDFSLQITFDTSKPVERLGTNVLFFVILYV